MFRHCITALLAILAFRGLPAQDGVARSAFGIGVSLSPLSFIDDESASLTFTQPTILLPIRRGGTIFEPEFAIQRSEVTERGGATTTSRTFNVWRLGVGILFETGAREQLRPYLGGRVGVQRGEMIFDNGFGGDTELDIKGSYMALVAGAQYYLAPAFSLGGEAQLGRASSTTDPAPATGPERTSTSVMTQGVVTIRWYF